MKTTTLITLLVICLWGCAPDVTHITGTWKSPAAGEDRITSILVTAMTGRTDARQEVENDLATALQHNGIKVIRSIDVIPPRFTNRVPERDDIMSRIDETDVDAILTVALIDEETETRYVPGNYGYEPIPRFGFYGQFWGYYTRWYPTLYSPGYYEEDKIYFIETNLYDADSEELLWSAQSEAINPRNLANFSEEFAEVVVARMIREGAIGTRTPSDFVDRN